MGKGWQVCSFSLSVLTLVNIVYSATVVEASRSFAIDYENDQFLMDGSPFRYVSGSLHYFRVPRAYWRDRLQKLRAAGLNAVSTYVEWSTHEPSPGNFNFSGEHDLQYFIQLAQEEDLYVLLRPGPYICAERDMGGLPPWLLTMNPEMKLRTNDTSYMEYVNRYLNYLMTYIQPLLYGNGGPVIMVQVENEYGSYAACDSNYTHQLRDLMKSFVGSAAILYTTDGGGVSYLWCGKIEDVYATVDFGTIMDVDSPFSAQRAYEPRGPLVNSEFYPGWLTHWNETFQTVETSAVVATLEAMLIRNASVNFYVFFGGTNFGFMAGANYGDNYMPQLTSYDYDAPLTEAGDPTAKYFAIREVIGRYLPLSSAPVPAVSLKGDYGTVLLNPVASLLDERIRQTLGQQPITNNFPLTFEQLGQKYGFVLYETVLTFSIPELVVLSIADIRDRAIILMDNVPKGVLSRSIKSTSLPITVTAGAKLQVLVENEGRINFGSKINDFKGIVSNVTLGGDVLTDWTITGYPLDDISQLSNINDATNFTFSAPSFFRGTFVLPPNTTQPLDTYLDPTGWGKGVAFINGFNLGRYWPLVGPQVTLYVPGCYLKPFPESNELVLLELQRANIPSYNVTFVTESVLDRLQLSNASHHAMNFDVPLQLNLGTAED